jgi:predicted deacylase
MNIQQFDLSSLEHGVKQIVPLDVALLPDGNPLRLHAMFANGRAAGPLVVVLAGIHGDEYEGILSIPEIYARLEPAALRGTVVCVPVCNVPAFVTATRSSPIDGANMARVFPGDPGGTITQRIAYWLGERLMRHADLIVDLHSAGVAYNLPMLIGYYRPSNETGQRTRQLAEDFGADVVWAHPDFAPGRTMSFAAERNIPGLYTEAPGGGRVRPKDFITMVEGVLNCLQTMGMLTGRPPVKRATHHLFGSGDLDHIINASTAGIFVAHTQLLSDVRKGDVLGEVRDVTGQSLETLHAPVDGVIITMRGLLRVNAGDGLFALAVRE